MSPSNNGVSYVSAMIGERERKMRISGRTLRLLHEQDFDLSRLQVSDEEREKWTDLEAMDYGFTMIWVSLLAFEPEITVDDVELEILPGEMEAAIDAATEALRRYAPKAEDNEGEKKAKGKVPAAA